MLLRTKRSFGLLIVVVVVFSSVDAAFLPSNSCSSPAGLITTGSGFHRTNRPTILFSSTLDKEETKSTSSSRIDDDDANVNVDAKQQANNNNNNNNKKKRFKIVLVAGFESFNRGLYQGLNDVLDNNNNDVEVTVFADSDIRLPNKKSLDPNDVGLNPIFARAVQEADSFIGSLIFDYDDVLAVKEVLPAVKGPRVSGCDCCCTFQTLTQQFSVSCLAVVIHTHNCNSM